MWEKIKYFLRISRVDVYCNYCKSCGETECCSPIICVNHPKGLYCESNMAELRASYKVLDRLYSWLSENQRNSKITAKVVLDKIDELEVEIE